MNRTEQRDGRTRKQHTWLPRSELGNAQQLPRKFEAQGEAHYRREPGKRSRAENKYNFATQNLTTTSHFPASVFPLFK